MDIVNGDLIEAFLSGKMNVLGHQANFFTTIGAAIALQIKKKLPEAYQADYKTLRGNIRKLGTLSYAVIGSGMVFNLYGRFKFCREKRQTDYDALRSALRLMADKLRPKQARRRIVLSKPGCNNAGGDWNVGCTIIGEELNGFDVTIYQQ